MFTKKDVCLYSSLWWGEALYKCGVSYVHTHIYKYIYKMVVMKKRRSRCKRPRGFDISNCQCLLEVPSLDILSTLLQPCSETAALLNF